MKNEKLCFWKKMQVAGHYYSKIFNETKKVHGIKSCYKLVVKLADAFEYS